MSQMVQWAASLGAWTLVIIAKLGIPVAILFALGYALYRRHPGRGQYEEDRGRLQGSRASGKRKACWEVRGCPPEMRASCPAFQEPDIPCWQAVKQASGGHIASRCFECSLLLSWEGARVTNTKAA